MAMDITGALTRKFGPLPAWAWAGIGGGGLWWYRQHTGPTATDQAAAASNPAYVGPYGQDPYGIQGGAGISGGGSNGGGGSVDPGTGGGTGGGVGTGDTGAAPPTIIVNPPAANSGRPRAQKPKPQHAKQPTNKGKPKAKRAPATTHHNAPRPTTQRAAHSQAKSRAVTSDRRQAAAVPKKAAPPARKRTRR